MINIGDLLQWTFIENKHGFFVPETRSGVHKISVNSADYVTLYWFPVTADGEVPKSAKETLLARFWGFEEIEFRTTQPVMLVGDGDWYINTLVGADVEHAQSSDSFTRPIERRTLAPEVAEMLRVSRLNMLRMEQHVAGLAGQVTTLNAALANNDAPANAQDKTDDKTKKPDDQGAVDGNRAQRSPDPEPNKDGNASDNPAGKGGKGNEPSPKDGG